MSLVKYRLKEVASDFGVAPKEIAEIIGQFFSKPKSNTQVPVSYTHLRAHET